MTDTDREMLRTTFGQDAELYDKWRPGYPPPLFTDLAALAGLGPRARVLEIGCGTGQATSRTRHHDSARNPICALRPPRPDGERTPALQSNPGREVLMNIISV